MKYPAKNLGPGETIVFDTHAHWIMWARWLFLAFIYLVVWLVLGSTVVRFVLQPGAHPVVFGIFLAVFIALLAWTGLVALKWSFTNLVLTSQRVIFRTGVIARQARETLLSRVRDVSYAQTVPERIMGAGDILVESSGEMSDRTPYRYMPRPEELKMKIVGQVQALEAGQGIGEAQQLVEAVTHAVNKAQPTQPIAPLPQEKPPVYSEIVDQIERLDTLRQRGVISEEEFRKAKDALLSKLGRGEEPGR